MLCPNIHIDKFIENYHCDDRKQINEDKFEKIFSRILNSASFCIPKTVKEDKQELANQVHAKLDELNKVLKRAKEAGLKYFIDGNIRHGICERDKISIELYEVTQYQPIIK